MQVHGKVREAWKAGEHEYLYYLSFTEELLYYILYKKKAKTCIKQMTYHV